MGTASARSLHPKDQLAHYVIVGPLGAGGMGEVYLAHDQHLERNIALKILPPDLVRNEERVRRFVREARSASSLNHPNIVTIHEIGQAAVRSPQSDKPASHSSVHYISMELISGDTLATKIHRDRETLTTLLGYLAQAAEGLAKAHSAGVIHRDLKPSNIMVSNDGFAKVLDFGLAKLVERESGKADGSLTMTETMDDTRAGVVLGTVGYMSPEQIRGGPVDNRSDIFSFGCILYEAATGRRPFESPSSIETMHKILHEDPVPVEEWDQAIPAELARLIRRCLAKNPDQRVQTSRDLVNELREIAIDDRVESGSRGATGSNRSSKRSRTGLLSRRALITGSILALLLVGGVFLYRSARTPSRPSVESGSAQTIPIRGLLLGLALSPDGNFLAYGQLSKGERSLWVRQLVTGSDIEILPSPLARPPNHLTFSPDGQYLYYVMADPARDGYSSLFRMPVLGGQPRKVVDDVDSRITFSPDAKRICFRRGHPERNVESLIILNLDSQQERQLVQIEAPATFCDPAWSPDGKTIAAVERDVPGTGHVIATYRIRDGHRGRLGAPWPDLQTLGGIAWARDGKSIIAAASDRPVIPSFSGSDITPNLELWRVSYPDGNAIRITSDANSYGMITISVDGTIAATRSLRQADLWEADLGSSHSVRQVTFGSVDEGIVRRFDTMDDGGIVFEALRGGADRIYRVTGDGAKEQLLTEEHGFASDPWYRRGVGIVHLRAGKDLIPHIWSMAPDGQGERQLTKGNGERTLMVSPDGSRVLFSRTGAPNTVWVLSVADARESKIGPSALGDVTFSPDGTRFLHYLPLGPWKVVNSATGKTEPTPAFPPGSFGIRWTPDQKSFWYLNNVNYLRNPYRFSVGADSPTEMTLFSDGRVFPAFQFSPDGKRVLFPREIDNHVNLWVMDVDGRHARPVTHFETGTVYEARWSRDGERAVFRYGTIDDDAILIQGVH